MAQQNPSVLIIGDWVVDEYWFLLKHQSTLSSYTSYAHYRVSSSDTELIKDLCGAGHVARVLIDVEGTENKKYSLYGIGDWHPDDTLYFSHLLHKNKENCSAAKAKYRIMPDHCDQLTDIKLIPLYENGTTIRVIRQYSQQDMGIEQISRVDWEPLPAKNRKFDWEKLRKELPVAKDVVAIIIQDLNKGVITNDFIEQLVNDFPKAQWFVRMKLKNPSWLSLIKKNLALLVLGPEILSNESPWERWIVNGKVTKQALDLIPAIPRSSILLLSDRRELILKLKNSNTIFTGKSSVLPTPLTQLGWTTAVFAGLIHSMLWKEGVKDKNDIDGIVEALRIADVNCGVPLPSVIKYSLPSMAMPNVWSSNWRQSQKEWQQATHELGIIEAKSDPDTEPALEMWRGSAQISGYIACISKKQQLINEIGSQIRYFLQDQAPLKSLSILIHADPGSGKTLLAKSLARTFDINFLRFDITQMFHRENLLDLFDSVSTLQASTNCRLLVFVDEVNATLDGDSVFGAFLSPLEENFYVRSGNTHILRPCIWIFASSHVDEKGSNPSDKFSDFISRMGLIVSMDFNSLGKDVQITSELHDEARLEQVYLGATMIKNYYPDLQLVSKEVLGYFHNINPGTASTREIRKLASSLKDIQYGRVTRKNCKTWPDRYWKSMTDGDSMVRIKF